MFNIRPNGKTQKFLPNQKLFGIWRNRSKSLFGFIFVWTTNSRRSIKSGGCGLPFKTFRSFLKTTLGKSGGNKRQRLILIFVNDFKTFYFVQCINYVQIRLVCLIVSACVNVCGFWVFLSFEWDSHCVVVCVCTLLSFGLTNVWLVLVDLVNPSGPGSLTTKNNVPGMTLLQTAASVDI